MRCEIDTSKCKLISDLLHSLDIPKEEEEHNILKQLNEHEASNYYFLMVAICHQTQTLEGKINDTYFKGWDYLTKKYLQSVVIDKSILEPAIWIDMNKEKLRSIYHCDEYGLTLSDIDRRIVLINDLGTKLIQMNSDSFFGLYARSAGFILGNKNALGETLRKFLAYSDPVQKKTFFLLGIAKSILDWHYRDEHNLGAPVDYHEIRGHLRLGTVKIVDKDLANRFAEKTITAVDDVEIRGAVSNAIKTISSHLTNVGPMQLHYLFWNYFRNVCIRREPECASFSPKNGLPQRYKKALAIDIGSECIFSSMCDSRYLEKKLNEYELITDFY
jgi:hypothetical protein